jgi:hypothetical protein
LGGLKKRDHSGDLRIYEWITFKCIFKNWDWGHRLDWSGLG